MSVANQATDLFLNGLNDVDRPIIVCDRSISGDGGGIAVLIYDACLWLSEQRAR